MVRTAAPPSMPRTTKRQPPARAVPGSAVKLGGATQRLLPELVPLRFFGVAVFAHAATWAGILLFAEAFPGFHGGIGPALAVLHVAVLGVLLASAMGASFQMLPVAFALPPPPKWICDAAFVLLVGGGAGLVLGFSLTEPLLIIGGGALLGGAVAFHLATVARLVWRSGDHSPFRWHIAAALLAIVAAVTLAIGLALDFRLGGLENHQGVALTHFILAGFGFMGLFVMGFSQILVPMFAVAEPVGENWAWAAFGLAVLAIAGSAAGALADASPLLTAGAVTGFCAALCHVRQMTLILKGRMRTRLGQEFVLIKTAWIVFPLSLGISLMISLDIGPDTLPVFFFFIVIFGWYLTFLFGVLQRILPFLASMHAARLGAKALSPAKLTSPDRLTIHQWCHFVALSLVGAGLLLGNVALIRLGALAGMVGAISFIVFGFEVLKRTRAHLAGTPT